MDINLLKHALWASYSLETTFPSEISKRNKWNKSIGQCAVTSLIVNDYLGGIIKKGDIISYNVSHFRNNIENINIDLTIEQYIKGQTTFQDIKEADMKKLLRNSNERFKVLKNKVEEFLNNFNQIDKEINNCKVCSNKIIKFKHKSISVGKNRNLLFIGEAPAKNGRISSGKAFFDITNKLVPSGKILQKLLNIVGLNIEDITFIEAIKCLPVDRKYLSVCGVNCNKFLLSQIDLLKPNIVITLGQAPTKNILGKTYTFTKFKEIVGKPSNIEINGNSYIVIPIYHPSPISPLSYKGNINIFETIKQKYGDFINI